MSATLKIIDLAFPGEQDRLASMDQGIKWPVVYLIHNDDEIYVGETTSAHNRYLQHADEEAGYQYSRCRNNYQYEYGIAEGLAVFVLPRLAVKLGA